MNDAHPLVAAVARKSAASQPGRTVPSRRAPIQRDLTSTRGRPLFTGYRDGRYPDVMHALAGASPAAPVVGPLDVGVTILGLIAQREGRYDDALGAYRRAIELNARPAAAWTNLASVLQQLGRVEEARRALDAALEADPRFAIAHMNLGNLEAGAGDFRAARQEYERAIDLDPNYAPAYRNLGRVALFEHRPDLAEPAFRAALRLEPESAAAREGLEAALAMQRER